MGTGDILLRVTLWWPSIPSRGGQQYSKLIHATKTRLRTPAAWASSATSNWNNFTVPGKSHFIKKKTYSYIIPMVLTWYPVLRTPRSCSTINGKYLIPREIVIFVRVSLAATRTSLPLLFNMLQAFRRSLHEREKLRKVLFGSVRPQLDVFSLKEKKLSISRSQS